MSAPVVGEATGIREESVVRENTVRAVLVEALAGTATGLS